MPQLSADPVRRVLERPLAPYYLLAASSGALVLIGLVMVFSASSVRSYATFGSSSTVAQNQAVYVVLGLLLAVLASRMSYGGSALLPTMVGVGMLLSFARAPAQPGPAVLRPRRSPARPVPAR